MSTDLCIRGQRVFVDGALRPATLHIGDGRIRAVTGFHEVDAAARLVDAGTHLVTPGIIDSHVHINEPGRTEWEGFFTATEAAAAGGITTVVDMPLNCIPATTTAAAAEEKKKALRDQLHVDVAFWGGVVPGNVAELAGLAAFGVPGCKCFLCPSGVDEFPHVERAHLEAAMPVLRDLGLTLLVHAELPGPLEQAERTLQGQVQRQVPGQDPRSYQTYLHSRPNAAEDEAIALVIELCRRHRCRVHIVHLGSASALPMLRAAQAEGLPISAETCLHYLTFCAEEIPDGATHFKCAPPIREAKNREGLWQGLLDGTITMVVSDHSPCTPALKKGEGGDFLQAWGGISGLQLGLSVLFTSACQRGIDVAQMLAWNTLGTARLAGLAHKKGQLSPGFHADVVIWDDSASFTVRAEEVHHRHKLTPYLGRTLFGVVEKTFVGGSLAYAREQGVLRPTGSFVRV